MAGKAALSNSKAAPIPNPKLISDRAVRIQAIRVRSAASRVRSLASSVDVSGPARVSSIITASPSLGTFLRNYDQHHRDCSTVAAQQRAHDAHGTVDMREEGFVARARGVQLSFPIRRLGKAVVGVLAMIGETYLACSNLFSSVRPARTVIRLFGSG
ncbi:hypothetical protein NITHO_500030 [Nitrolancea hollandica Lb]|uniref:Uncharacterized protein n=1 Tax=Nitrolancea hollandica Lb TaxID=1129897 RepID=I4ELD3_9BACT|nr:hypothetical protein NITHO_500030 [Nitrolancea hollandica Lb]